MLSRKGDITHQKALNGFSVGPSSISGSVLSGEFHTPQVFLLIDSEQTLPTILSFIDFCL